MYARLNQASAFARPISPSRSLGSRPLCRAQPLSDSPGGLHVHDEWEFWMLNGVLHPADGVADPSSPVVLFNRNPQAEIGYLLLYGPSVLELAVRVLGYGLAWWALRGTPPKPTTYPQSFDFGSWN
jgi:hypothetical protein